MNGDMRSVQKCKKLLENLFYFVIYFVFFIETNRLFHGFHLLWKKLALRLNVFLVFHVALFQMCIVNCKLWFVNWNPATIPLNLAVIRWKRIRKGHILLLKYNWRTIMHNDLFHHTLKPPWSQSLVFLPEHMTFRGSGW